MNPAQSDNRFAAFANVNAWVFDLDNTLYPSEANLFAQVDARMTDYVAKALDLDEASARRIQKTYYADYGTTLAGLMARHNVDATDFLAFVHDIDVSVLTPCAMLRTHIQALPGRKFVFTNGSLCHAERVLAARGLDGVFDGIHDIAAGDLLPKPHAGAYDRFMSAFDVDPNRAAMFEDIPRNLDAPSAMGMATVLVRTSVDWSHEPEQSRPAGLDDNHTHVDFCTTDLTDFLSDVHHHLGRSAAQHEHR